MGTAILLSPQNTLNHRFDHQTLTHLNPNSCHRRHSYAATTTPRRRKRIPSASQSQPTVVKSPAANTNLVMGQVKILKRGETLSAFHNKETNSCSDRDDSRRPLLKMNGVDLIVTSTNRLGPEPETVKKQIGAFKGVEMFAGAGCSVSPSPNSVPIPCFLGKNKLSI